MAISFVYQLLSIVSTRYRISVYQSRLNPPTIGIPHNEIPFILQAQTQVYKEKIHELETKIKDLSSGMYNDLP